jgi:hypothetical protein
MLTAIVQSAICTALISILHTVLQRTAGALGTRCTFTDRNFQTEVAENSCAIPLIRVKDSIPPQYVSAIALKLATSWSIPPLVLAKLLLEQGAALSQIENSNADPLAPQQSRPQNSERGDSQCRMAVPITALGDLERRLLPHLTWAIAPPGNLHLHLSETGVALWLAWGLVPLLEGGLGRMTQRQAAELPPTVFLPSHLKAAPELFAIQHGIVRCHVVLSQAEREQFFLNPSLVDPNYRTLVLNSTQGDLTESATPTPQRPLTTSQYSASLFLASTLGQSFRRHGYNTEIEILFNPDFSPRLQQANAAEQQLLNTLIQTCDQLSRLEISESDSSLSYLQLAHPLSTAIHAFLAQTHQHNSGQPDPNLVCWRLLLIQRAYLILRSLVEEGLGIAACERF